MLRFKLRLMPSDRILTQPIALIVDDEEPLRMLLRDFLEDNFPGFHIEEACDGYEARMKVHRCRPDLVLLDIFLPGQTGFSVCEQIRGTPELSHVTIIALSGMEDKSVRETILSLGVNDFILKPYKIKQLQEKIEHHLPHAVMQRLAAFAAKNKAA